MSEPDACINTLDEWLISKKKSIYKTYITNPDNSPDGMDNYIKSLIKLANILINAINTESIHILKELLWPDELIECIKDLGARTVIDDRIKECYIHFPYVQNIVHMETIETEYTGIK